MTAIRIDSKGNTIEDISIEKCRFSKYGSFCICGGSSVSNGIIRRLNITKCEFVGKEGGEEESLDRMTIAVMLNASTSEDGGIATDTLLEDVLVKECHFHGGCRMSVNTMCACRLPLSQIDRKDDFSRSNIRNINIVDNELVGAWDAQINVISGLPPCAGSSIENINISNNRVEFGCWGIFAAAGEPVLDEINGVVFSNLSIKNNELWPNPLGAGEPAAAIGVNAARIDYFPCIIRNCIIENIEIHNNMIRGSERGITLDAAHSLLDGASGAMTNNIMRHVPVKDNQITSADEPFRFFGAYAEGRLNDWNIGVPRHDKRWAEAITDHTVVTTKITGNKIIDLCCEENIINGFRYRLIAAGAFARGHCVVKDNEFCDEIVIRNNIFNGGEDHVCVADTMSEDWIHDEGNRVDEDMKFKI